MPVTDLLPGFWNNATLSQVTTKMVCEHIITTGCGAFVGGVYLPEMEAIRRQYQGSLVAFAVAGEPNASGSKDYWVHPVARD